MHIRADKTGTPEGLQVFYELAMAIGNSLDLHPMLEESIQTYLQKLHCSGGVVFQIRSEREGREICEQIFSIPYRIQKNTTYTEAVKEMHRRAGQGNWQRFVEMLPMQGHGTGNYDYVFMDLPGFGLILLIYDRGGLPEHLINALLPINRKLALACNACVANRKVIEESQWRKRTEQKALENQERLARILETVQAGIVLIDTSEKIIVDANSSALKMLGRAREEVVGKVCHQFICPAEIGKCPITDLKQNVDNAERLLITETGEKIPILKTAAPVVLSGRNYLLESFIDLRKLKQVEAERDEMQNKLYQVQKLEALGTLSGGIAHDFNNILYAAIGFTELAIEDVPRDSRAAECLKNIMEIHSRAVELINQILTFSRETDEERKSILVQEILNEALKLVRKTIPANIEIRQEIDGSCLPVLANGTKLHQIVMNLCTNAYHAMQEKGGTLTVGLDSVRISVCPDDDPGSPPPGMYTKLTISDTGMGMDDAVQKRIFEPFFTTKPVGSGTGMGLSTVHGIVKTYGGSIQVASVVGQGSTFSVLLPVNIESEEKDGRNDNRIEMEGNEKILFVDDEERITRFVKMALDKRGYSTDLYTSSVEALDAFQAAPYQFDLVVTDMNMPKLTGMEIANRMMAIRPDIPIILCTGFSENITREQALALGLKEMLYKPVLTKNLLAAVRSALDEGGQGKEVENEKNSDY